MKLRLRTGRSGSAGAISWRRFSSFRLSGLLSVHPVLVHFGPILIPSYGALAALGVLLALGLALETATLAGLDRNQLWNLCTASVLAALAATRLLLVALNWTDLRQHPQWLLALAMMHHPLLGAAGSLAAAGTAVAFARWQKMPLRPTADALAAPLALGLAFEQVGELLAGTGYGSLAAAGFASRWAVVSTDPLAALWSGVPLGLPLIPIQACAAAGFLALAGLLFAWLPRRHQKGDLAAFGLIGGGAVVFGTEFWRNSAGRGLLLGGALNSMQAIAVAMVLAGGWLLLELPPSAPQANDRQAVNLE
jgi:phosphatidylglycerol:prolipoprotein diacylglycerol transferase